MSIALILKEVRPDLGLDIAAKYDFVFNFIQRMAGGYHLDFNNSVFLSERRACDRNSALAHFMLENKCLPAGIEVKKIIDLYCQVRKVPSLNIHRDRVSVGSVGAAAPTDFWKHWFCTHRF